LARALHQLSPRAGAPFVSFSCVNLPEHLVEDELFGHERGAFTGAHQRRRGKFELADGGTLFLDEIGDLEERAQAKLLRALESGIIERLGGDRQVKVDVRVIAATNRELEREAGAGRFRADLLYRLNVFPIQVPPLRDRPEDVPALVAHFAARAGARCGRPARPFGPEALERFRQHSWPGNVRELANAIERLTIVGDGSVSGTEAAAVLSSGAPKRTSAMRDAVGSLSAAMDGYEAELIRDALADARGNVAEAARRLQTDRANLYRRMKRLGLQQTDTPVSE
ncbi:MAG: sigma-54-dependent Fis family transcriptional regulator, partial [Gemmatimonadetes bacterium]|nr:sigma-54-dependent Fis family transcriptional regulator [Gemmatimonadota bacterium]